MCQESDDKVEPTWRFSFSSSVARTSKARGSDDVSRALAGWRKLRESCGGGGGGGDWGSFGGVSDEPPGDFFVLEVDQLFLNLRCVKKLKLYNSRFEKALKQIRFIYVVEFFDDLILPFYQNLASAFSSEPDTHF